MIRARFYIRKDDCDNDYRPVKWPIKYPYWCSAESSNMGLIIGRILTTDLNGIELQCFDT